MAEERLMDDDKDRKYKIRKNEDGEEELVVVEPDEDEDGESDIPVFNIPVYDEDDEEAATLTPEQLAERERKKKEEESSREKKTETLLGKCRAKLGAGDFESALYNASQAELLAEDNGEVYFLKLKALSHNLTDFISLEECSKASDGVREYCNEEQKAELKTLSSTLEKRIAEEEERCAKLCKENDEAKAERREVFANKKSKALKNFLITAVPFTVFLILAVIFGSMMFANEHGVYLITAIVFAALAAITLIFTLFTANRLWTAARNVRLNEKDSSTKLGREYAQSKTRTELLKNIKASFENDLS